MGDIWLGAGNHLSGVGSAVREFSRSTGDPGHRTLVDLRGPDSTVPRHLEHEHLHPGRFGDAHRLDQQTRNSGRRIRQPAT
ncbi:hypothetical protein D3C77_707910 [compost metagenome]